MFWPWVLKISDAWMTYSWPSHSHDVLSAMNLIQSNEWYHKHMLCHTAKSGKISLWNLYSCKKVILYMCCIWGGMCYQPVWFSILWRPQQLSESVIIDNKLLGVYVFLCMWPLNPSGGCSTTIWLVVYSSLEMNSIWQNVYQVPTPWENVNTA